MNDKDIDDALANLSNDIRKDRLWGLRITVALVIIAVLTVVLVVWKF